MPFRPEERRSASAMCPRSNTDVENTSKRQRGRLESRVYTGYHWLDATLDTTDPNHALLLLGLEFYDEAIPEERMGSYGDSWYGFRSRLISNIGMVLYDPNRRFRARLVMAGQDCINFAERFGRAGVVQLLEGVQANAKWIHRLDVYVDDCAGLFTMEQIQTLYLNRDYQSRVKSKVHLEGEIGGPLSTRLGSTDSTWYVLTYDKAAEVRAAAGRTHVTVDDAGHWIRWEVRTRKHVAREFLARVAKKQELDLVIKSTLSGCLTFTKKNSSDSNAGRWPAHPRWLKLIDSARPAILSRPPASGLGSLERSRRRWCRSVAAFTRQRGLKALWNAIADGDASLKPRQLLHIDPSRRPDMLDLNSIPAEYNCTNQTPSSELS